MTIPRVAIVGAGPSGLYAGAALASCGQPVEVDVIDRLPAPYGLVRYGVAPDHVKMKSVIRMLRKPFEATKIHFLGNLVLGRDATFEELRDHYHAVVHATGNTRDRDLGIPGELLPGSLGSGQMVGWYSGHPDHTEAAPPLDCAAVAVVGAGNVALDIARVLAKSAAEMALTDVPDEVLAALTASQVKDIHLFIRRSPQHVRFTPAELAQIGELANADVVVHDDGQLAGLSIDPEEDRRMAENIELLQGWARGGSPRTRPRRIHLHFLRSPVEVLGDNRVAGLVVERNTTYEQGGVRGTGETETYDVGLVVRAIGYRGDPIPGLPFDVSTGTVPHQAGRVIGTDGRPVSGAYVTGWIKRGPTGIIGTNKGDAAETVAQLLEDLAQLPVPAHPEREHWLELLRERGVPYVDWSSWLRLDAEEERLGGTRGADRIKVSRLEQMLAACHARAHQH